MAFVLGRRQFNLLTAATLAMASSTDAAVTDMQKVRVGVCMRNSMFHLPLVLADQLGYLRQAGISLDWHDFDAGVYANHALLAGQVDVVSGAFEHVLDFNDRGSKLQAFVLQGRTPQISLGLAMRRLADYRTLSDLRHLRIGVTALGSATHAMANVWCLQAGVNPLDMQYVEVGNMTAAMESLRNGSVDGLCHIDPLMSWLEYKSDLRVLAETRTLQSTQMWLGGATASACLYAKSDFLNLKEELIQGMTDAVLRALKWLLTAGPTDLLKAVPPNAWLGDRAFYLGTLNKIRESYSPDGLFADELLQTAWRSRAVRLGLPRINVIDRTALMAASTNTFVRKAKKRSMI